MHSWKHSVKPTRTASNWPIPVYMPCSRGPDRAKLVSGHSQYTVLPSLRILPTKRKISLCLESTKTKVVLFSEIPKNHSRIYFFWIFSSAKFRRIIPGYIFFEFLGKFLTSKYSNGTQILSSKAVLGLLSVQVVQVYISHLNPIQLVSVLI